MIVNFSDIVFDAYGKLERPTLFLKTLAGQSIQPIVQYYNLKTNFQYNDVSSITFDITNKFHYDGELLDNPVYEEICGLRIVDMEPFGEFILMQPHISDDGIKRVKSCTAYSLEYELNFKSMPPLSESDGGYKFYNTANSNSSLMHIVMSKLPNWTIGHVDPSVCDRVRNFSTSSENIYSFLMNTVQESYNCLFIFDTKNRKINVYDASDDARIENLPIYISKENLINEIELNELTEDIVTCLSVYGADNISINSVNPLGTDKLYNIDYFIEIGDVPPSIAEKWKTWRADVDMYQKLFSGVYSQYYSDVVTYNSQSIKLDELNYQLDTEQTILSSYRADTDANSDHSSAIKSTEERIKSLTTDIEAQKTTVNNAKSAMEKSKKMMSDIVALCKFENYFADYERDILDQFFKEGSIQDSTFVSTNVATTPDSCLTVVPADDFKISITDANLYRSDEYVKLTEEEKRNSSFSTENLDLINSIESEMRTYLNKNFYTINVGNIVISNKAAYDANGNVLDDEQFADSSFYVKGTVTNSTVSYDKTALSSGGYNSVVTLTITDVTYNGVRYGTATFTAIGEIKSFNHSNHMADNKDTMSFSVSSGILTLTCKNSIYQKQETIQQLYDYGKACINKLAYPSYEFQINSSNFIFSKQFETFKDQIELGKSINVEFYEDLFRRPILIGVELNYEDLTDFNLTFSNKFRSNSAEFLLSDVIGKSATTMSNLDASKFSYAAFSNSTLQNDVTTLMNEAFDVSKKQILNAKNQSLLIDDSGIHLRKVANKITGEFSPNQIRMINNKIAFTSDNWESVNLAIGEMNVGGTTFMGVVADSLIGKALIGNQLTIESNRINDDGSSGIMTFRVDGQGAYLGNGSLYFEDVASKNKIAIDPKYGLIAGDQNLFQLSPTGATMKAIKSDGTFEHDGKFQTLPKGASFWLNTKNNTASFRGDIYANNGYFAGNISANAIVERSSSKKSIETIITEIDAAIQDAKTNTTGLNATLNNALKKAYEDYANSEIKKLDDDVARQLGLNTTRINEQSVISPYIAGGYLNITGDRYRVIIDPQNKTTSGQLFQIHDLTVGKTLLGFNNEGNLYVDGYLYGRGGEIGGWSISGNQLSSSHMTIDSSSGGGKISCSNSDGSLMIDSGGLEYRLSGTGNRTNAMLMADGLIFTSYNNIYQSIDFYTGDRLDLTISNDGIGNGTGTASITPTQNGFDVTGYLYPRRLYLENSAGIRGMKSGGGEATLANSICIAYVNEENEVVIGHDGGNSNKSVNTFIRSGSNKSTYLMCNGTVGIDDNRYAIRFFKSGDHGWFRPCKDDSTNLGGTNYYWKNLYAKSHPIGGSDRNMKHDINNITDQYLEFYDKIQPVTFMFNDGDRIHAGYISQDVERALIDSGLTAMDFAGFCKDTLEDGTERYALRYSEFIALNTAKIKQLEKIIFDLKEEVATLRNFTASMN